MVVRHAVSKMVELGSHGKVGVYDVEWCIRSIQYRPKTPASDRTWCSILFSSRILFFFFFCHGCVSRWWWSASLESCLISLALGSCCHGPSSLISDESTFAPGNQHFWLFWMLSEYESPSQFKLLNSWRESIFIVIKVFFYQGSWIVDPIQIP